MPKDSQSNRDRDQTRRDVLVLLLALAGMFACLMVTAQMAITPASAWRVPANMLSEINPDKGYATRWMTLIEPLRPEVMTPPPWNLDRILTPVGRGVIVSPMVLAPALTGTVTPREVAQVPTFTNTPSIPQPTAATPTTTARPTGTPLPTRTLPPTTVSPTLTPLLTATPTHSPIPTATPTNSPIPTATPTSQLPPRPATATPTNTPTTTNTPTPTPTTDAPPATPTGLRAAAGDTQIILGWNANAEPDLAGYRVYSSTTGSLPYAFLITVTSPATGYLNQPLTNGTVYSYYVTAFDTVGNESEPSSITSTQPYNITPYTYTVNVTCVGVSDCNNAGGQPDGSAANVGVTATLTLDFGAGHGIIDGSGYDMVFYEWSTTVDVGLGPEPGILLDNTIIELSADGTTWYTVFAWDGAAGGVSATNIDSYATDGNGEMEDEPIPSRDLYGQSPYKTGIGIDIGRWTPPGYSYHLVRFRYPPTGTQGAQVDAVQRLH
jgi:hypothetical protein